MLTFSLAALLSATPLVAQNAPPASPDTDVTVTGTRPAERQQEIREFIRTLTPVPATGQISRFENDFCPAINNVTPAARTAILARMRTVAAEIGLRVGAPNCRPNMLLMLTRDKEATIWEIARRYPHSFGVDRGSRPRDVVAQPGPTSVWYATALLDAGGRELGMFQGVFANWTVSRPTRISSGARPTFIAAAVLIEEQALNGLTTTQIADYALMRAIARIDPARLPTPAMRSILNVLDIPMGQEMPPTMTRWDMGFLRGLYNGRATNLRAAQARGEIAQRIAAELDGPESGRNR